MHTADKVQNALLERKCMVYQSDAYLKDFVSMKPLGTYIITFPTNQERTGSRSLISYLTTGNQSVI